MGQVLIKVNLMRKSIDRAFVLGEVSGEIWTQFDNQQTSGASGNRSNITVSLLLKRRYNYAQNILSQDLFRNFNSIATSLFNEQICLGDLQLYPPQQTVIITCNPNSNRWHVRTCCEDQLSTCRRLDRFAHAEVFFVCRWARLERNFQVPSH